SDSLLSSMSPEIKWENIKTIEAKTTLDSNGISLNLKGLDIEGEVAIDKDDNINGRLDFASALLNAQGTTKSLQLSLDVSSLENLQIGLANWYKPRINLPKGGLKSDIVWNSDTPSTIALFSNELYIGEQKKPIADLRMQITRDKNIWNINSYEATYDNERVFSSRPSVIEFADNILRVESLWINDQIQIQGTYNLQSAQGNFAATANPFDIKTKWINISGNLNLDALLDGNAITLSGTIDISSGSIGYNFEQKTFPNDEDIIILQEQKVPSPFFENLNTSLKIKTSSPIKYSQGRVSLDIIANLGIEKVQQSPMMMAGMITIPKGGTYYFENKKFTLQESYIYFTGDPNKPQLDIKANYMSLNHEIKIAITGSPSMPNITFSSTPRLTREQILSILLFDSESGADTHSSEEMMKIMGGAIAKSALADVGIAVDHLVLGGDSVEVGKKLTDKITVIYVDGAISGVKVKYNHSRTVEGVVSVSQESTSVDIFYKKEVESLGDIIYSPKP
ncbi:MAG TPA: hypothetical protein ENN12_04680, partial [Epsilonproteobacteria bacterium]|nr:hypothetical protein [Campylobacterota bacterium]